MHAPHVGSKIRGKERMRFLKDQSRADSFRRYGDEGEGS